MNGEDGWMDRLIDGWRDYIWVNGWMIYGWMDG